MVDEMGLSRNIAAVLDKSWIWQMYCRLSEERRRKTTYSQYEVFILGAVGRLEVRLLGVASKTGAGAGEKASQKVGQVRTIVDVSSAKCETTSHGQGHIPIAEVIDVEKEDFSLLGDGNLQGAGKDEQLGTSHARGKEDPERVIPLEQDGSNGVVSNSSFSLAISNWGMLFFSCNFRRKGRERASPDSKGSWPYAA